MSFSYISEAMFMNKYLTLFMLCLVRSFSYTPDANFSEDFLLHFSRYVYWAVSLTLLVLYLVRSHSYTPDDSFSEEFLLQSSCYF